MNRCYRLAFQHNSTLTKLFALDFKRPEHFLQPYQRIKWPATLCRKCSNWLSLRSERNVTLDYTVYGDNKQNISLSPIIVSHGVFGSKDNWKSLCKEINLITGRRVFAYDAVNHGASSHHGEMSYDDMAYDLLRLMGKIGAKKSILIGHSMGGKTAMTTALRFHQRVEQLIVVDTSPSVTSSAGEVLTYMKAMASIDFSVVKTRKAVSEALLNVAKSASLRQFLMKNLDSTRGILTWRCNLPALIRNYPLIHGFPVFDDHVTFGKSTLFVGGGRSFYITDRHYPEIKRLFPLARIKHIADAGHWVHSEKPKEFVDLVTEFII